MQEVIAQDLDLPGRAMGAIPAQTGIVGPESRTILGCHRRPVGADVVLQSGQHRRRLGERGDRLGSDDGGGDMGGGIEQQRM